MLVIKLNEVSMLKLYFNYTKISADRKQEVKGSRFRRRTTEAVLELHFSDATVHETKIVGSAINDSLERFDRVHGREAALRNLTDGLSSSLMHSNWGLPLPSTEMSELIWTEYRRVCTRKVKPQFRSHKTSKRIQRTH